MLVMLPALLGATRGTRGEVKEHPGFYLPEVALIDVCLIGIRTGWSGKCNRACWVGCVADRRRPIVYGMRSPPTARREPCGGPGNLVDSAAVWRPFILGVPQWGCIGGLYWEILGAILGRLSGTGRAVLCAKHKEIKTAFDSRSVAPESLHETMFPEHVSGELKL
jgi:hypothetical protein